VRKRRKVCRAAVELTPLGIVTQVNELWSVDLFSDYQPAARVAMSSTNQRDANRAASTEVSRNGPN
jgi:hypothetical protein